MADRTPDTREGCEAPTMQELPADEQRERVWRALPAALGTGPALYVDELARRLALTDETVRLRLGELRREGRARHHGNGLWRAA